MVHISQLERALYGAEKTITICIYMHQRQTKAVRSGNNKSVIDESVLMPTCQALEGVAFQRLGIKYSL